MKIFSLQSKISVFVWSIVLGIILNYAVVFRSIFGLYNCSVGDDCEKFLNLYRPFANQLASLFFWILASFIVLMVVRWFRERKTIKKINP